MSQEYLRDKGQHSFFIPNSQTTNQYCSLQWHEPQMVTHSNQYQQAVTSQKPTFRYEPLQSISLVGQSSPVSNPVTVPNAISSSQ